MLSELEQKLDRRRLAFVLGVKQRDLDSIESGYVPGARVAERIRKLHGLRGEIDLDDLTPVQQALGVRSFGPFTPRMFAAFVAVDLAIGVVIVAVVLLRT